MANKNVNDFQYPLFNDVLEGMEKKNDSGGGGSDLPTPTEADAGKAIVVNNSGEYVLDNVGGGALICTDTNGTLDKTMGEIQAAAQAGVPVVVLQTDNMRVVVTVVYVHQGISTTYTGQLQLWGGSSYGVTETTEAGALAAYPIYQPK